MAYKDPEKQKVAQREWYERNDICRKRRERKKSIQRFLRAVKVTAGCRDCGYDAHAVALDFDHRDDEEKKFFSIF